MGGWENVDAVVGEGVTTRRPVGLTQDVGYEIGASATLPHPPEQVFALLVRPGGTDLWLAPGVALPRDRGTTWTAADGSRGQVRGFVQDRRLRTTLLLPGRHHVTTAQVTTMPADGGRCVLRFHEEHLLDAAERARRREHYRTALAAVAGALGRG